jgi:hypothetical protein
MIILINKIHKRSTIFNLFHIEISHIHYFNLFFFHIFLQIIPIPPQCFLPFL